MFDESSYNIAQVEFFVGVQLDMEVAHPEDAAKATQLAAADAVCKNGASGGSAAEGDGRSQRGNVGGEMQRPGPVPSAGRRNTAEVGSAAAAAQEAAEHFSELSAGKLRTVSAPVDRRSVDSLLPAGQTQRRPPLDRSKAFEAFLSNRQSFGGDDAGSGALPTISETGSLSSRASREVLIHKGTVGAGAFARAVQTLTSAILLPCFVVMMLCRCCKSPQVNVHIAARASKLLLSCA